MSKSALDMVNIAPATIAKIDTVEVHGKFGSFGLTL